MANSILAKMAVLISGDTSGLSKGVKSATKELNAFEKTAKGIGGTLAASIGAISFGLIARQVIEVTSTFQRFEAVLTNTLGSGSEAQKALTLIKDFASKTPFSVEQLTGAFVKLANQGFVPTRDELRKLGDLASSTGKDFDQLAEAILDAQTGQFERLKEFGIKAKKQGDQVEFSFKGVQTQVAFTSDEIQKYILSLGDLEGVSGAMAAISETLGGRISNLGDSFDGLLLSLGNLTSGPLVSAIEGLTKLVNLTTDLLGGESNPLAAFETGLNLLNSGVLTAEQYAEALRVTEERAAKLGIELIKLTDGVSGVTKVLVDPRSKINIADPATVGPQIKSIQLLEDEIRNLNNEFKTTDVNNIKQLAHIKSEINARTEQIAKIEELFAVQQKLTAFAQKQLENAELGITTNVDVTQGTGFKRTLDNAIPTELPAPDVSLMMNNLEFATGAVIALKDAYGELGGQAIATTDQQILAGELVAEAEGRKAQAFEDASSIILGTAQDVISGQKTALQGIIAVTARLLPILLAQANAGVIAGAGKTALPPPAIIALAAAGLAAIGSMFSKATGHSGRGGGGASAATRNVGRAEAITPTAQQPQAFEFVLHGNDLVASQTTELNRKLRLGR